MMKTSVCLVLFLSACGGGGGGESVLSRAARARQDQPTHPTRTRYGKLPLRFEANRGQFDPSVDFVAHGSGYLLMLRQGDARIEIDQSPAETRQQRLDERRRRRLATLELKLAGSNRDAAPVALERMPGRVNYFIGNDRRRWRTDLSLHAAAGYEQVYPGIDILYYGNQGALELDFLVQPGGDPSAIVLELDGADSLRIDESGDLVIRVAGTELRQPAPILYQEDASGARREVSGAFRLLDERRVGFTVGEYDRDRLLVIDPVLMYSSYFGGSGREWAGDIAVDASGALYVTGFTDSPDFLTHDATGDAAAGPIFAGGGDLGEGNELINMEVSGDAYLLKLNPAGDEIVFLTYLGGSHGDEGAGVEVDSAGRAFVVGNTLSRDFPGEGAIAGGDVFVVGVSPSGDELLFTRILGGNGVWDLAHGSAIDAAGRIYIAGETDSTNFIPGPTFGAECDRSEELDPCVSVGFVARLDPQGPTFEYVALINGGLHGSTIAHAVAVDDQGAAYLTGRTSAEDFPATGGPFPVLHHKENRDAADEDAFILKLDPSGTAIRYATFFGAWGADRGLGIAVGPGHEAIVAGTAVGADNPETPGVVETFPMRGGATIGYHAGAEGFVVRMNESGTDYVYSALLGGSGFDAAHAVAVDTRGHAFVVGTTASDDMLVVTTPHEKPLQPRYGGGGDAFVAEIDAGGNRLVWLQFAGGWAFDAATAVAVGGCGIYLAGTTWSSASTVTPTGGLRTAMPVQPGYGGGGDVFVMKLESDADGDAIPDCWEIAPVDINGDGVIDLDLRPYGLSKDHKDLIVEIDYMVGAMPLFASLQSVIDAFRNSPVANPDGIPGIALHLSPGGILDGFLDEQVPLSIDITFSEKRDGPLNDFDDYKRGWPHNPCGTDFTDGHFGTTADRASPNCEFILAAKRRVFRYAIFGHKLAGSDSSGESDLPLEETLTSPGRFGGDDFVVTVANWGSTYMLTQQQYEEGTLMHELGHALGLRHGGVDHINHKPNYLSIMSYSFQFPGLFWNRPLDYSRLALPTLDETNLNEFHGLWPSPLPLTTVYSPNQPGVAKKAPVGPLIDWNGNGILEPAIVADISTPQIPDPPLIHFEVLVGFEDWSNLVYGFRDSPLAAPGAHPVDEKETQTREQIEAAYGAQDFDDDELPNSADNCDHAGNPDQRDGDGDGIGDVCEPEEAELSLRIDDSPDPVGAGEPLRYTLTVENRSDHPANGVRVDGTLTQYRATAGTASQGSWQVTSGVVSWQLGALAAGATATLTLDGAALAAGTRQSQLTVSGGAPDPNPANNTASVTTTVEERPADLIVTQIDAPDPALLGSPVTYTIRARNLGPGPANQIALLHTVQNAYYESIEGPGPCDFDGVRVRCTVERALLRDEEESFTMVVVPTGGLVTSTASASAAELDPDGANNQSIETTTVEIPNAADLVIWQQDSIDPAPLNGRLYYAVTVENRGPRAATGVIVDDRPPSSATYYRGTATQGTVGALTAGVVRWSVGTLESGAQATLLLEVYPRVEGSIVNRASATANEPDPAPADNESSEATAVGSIDLELTVEESADPVEVGRTAAYQFTVRNLGPSPIDDANLTSYLPGETVVRGVTVSQGAIDDVHLQLLLLDWHTGPIAVGAVATVTLELARSSPGTSSFSAMVSPNDNHPQNNTVNLSTTWAGSSDVTPPTTSASVTPAPNAAGWVNVPQPITVVLTAADDPGGTGVREIRYLGPNGWVGSTEPSVTVTRDALFQGKILYYSVDWAGNSEAQKFAGKDYTAPTVGIQVAGTRTTIGAYIGSATVTLSAVDSLSGIDRIEARIDGGTWTVHAPPSTVLTVETPGTHLVEMQAYDVAGNHKQRSTTLTVVGEKPPTSVFAWGREPDGSTRAAPAAVANLDGSVALAGAVNNNRLAIAWDGSVSGWGENRDGQLGRDDFSLHVTPGIAYTLFDYLRDVRSVALGSSVAYAVDGAGWLWYAGRDPWATDSDTAYFDTWSPLYDVSAIAAGADHALAVRSDGSVWAWGYNRRGQLGVSTAPCAPGTDAKCTVPVRVEGIEGAVQVAAGLETSFALLGDGTVLAWGANLEGELGDGTTTQRNTAVAVKDASGAPFGDVLALATQWRHVLAVKRDGTLWAWGLNDRGQLGDGTVTRRLFPTRVPTLTRVVDVAATRTHSLAAGADGALWSWGGNASGELGHSTSTTCTKTKVPCSKSPAKVNGVDGVTHVAGGGTALDNASYSLALRDATPPSPTALHVASLLTTSSSGTPQTSFAAGSTIYWRARIVDQIGRLMSGATVTTRLARPDGTTAATPTAVSDQNGWALFSFGTRRNDPKGGWSVRVTSVTAGGATWDTAADQAGTIGFVVQ